MVRAQVLVSCRAWSGYKMHTQATKRVYRMPLIGRTLMCAQIRQATARQCSFIVVWIQFYKCSGNDNSHREPQWRSILLPKSDSTSQISKGTIYADHIDLALCIRIHKVFYLLHRNRTISQVKWYEWAGHWILVHWAIESKQKPKFIHHTECRLVDNWDILLLSFAYFSHSLFKYSSMVVRPRSLAKIEWSQRFYLWPRDNLLFIRRSIKYKLRNVATESIRYHFHTWTTRPNGIVVSQRKFTIHRLNWLRLLNTRSMHIAHEPIWIKILLIGDFNNPHTCRWKDTWIWINHPRSVTP